MSLKAGIGKGWFDKWETDVFPADHCIINGVETKPPIYYLKKLKEKNPVQHEEILYNRSITAKKFREDNTNERLLDKEHVLMSKLRLLKREL